MHLTEELIQRKILEGELPANFNGRTRAGHGEGHACKLCGEKIDASKVEYEIEGRNAAGATRIIRLDGECFQAWLVQTDRNH